MNQPQNQNPPNRLVNETSPYLLQHAYNPVDWFPWCDEAFELALQQDKPVFLSIGYSACHWCHVMEHESFENPQIAQLMNEKFINIKVDREERPDLDQIYMASVQLITRQGGWPMSVFLDHERAPFYGGTYWPPVSRHGMPGFADILRRVSEYWHHKREECLRSSSEIVEAISRMDHDTSSFHRDLHNFLKQDLVVHAGKKLLRTADYQHGGFGTAPKFPHSMDIRVLIRYAKKTDDPEALKIIKLTLDKMGQGGIYDHLAGGFARYSTDERWLVPHFEKMLYDNALLVPTYLEGWQLTGDEQYKAIVRETLDFILHEMTAPEGSFYSTQDADSEGEEGKFYVWSAEEIIRILGEKDARIFNFVYDVTPPGNWEGTTILNRQASWVEIGKMLKISLEELFPLLERCRKKLYEIRSQRTKPGRDEKVLTSWNGLMISAMAMAGKCLNEPRYIQAAERACQFILQKMREPDGRLWHAFKDGKARFNAYLDDYSCLAEGLIELFMSTGSNQYLNSARELLTRIQEQFGDPDGGAFFYTSIDHEQLVFRNKDTQDNATPSGNTMAATAFLKMYLLTGEASFQSSAVEILHAMNLGMNQYPLAYGQGLIAYSLLSDQMKTAFIISGENSQLAMQLQLELGKRCLTETLVIWSQTSDISPLFKDKPAINNQPTCYICQGQTCMPAISSEDEILKHLM